MIDGLITFKINFPLSKISGQKIGKAKNGKGCKNSPLLIYN